ncbi:YdbC family protein [Virgibacillus siamensis]|uniref:YdbC family protein n=1 Tax=Virgibacillus siamensis TaxID=480071 RepID=UPI00098504E2|nr:YdbC family protein [Virgibacillus siamensis]
MAAIQYEIIETIAVLSESPKGWTKELSLISWNGRDPKYDLRDWAPDKEKMGKGVTLTADELNSLKEALHAMG